MQAGNHARNDWTCGYYDKNNEAWLCVALLVIHFTSSYDTYNYNQRARVNKIIISILLTTLHQCIIIRTNDKFPDKVQNIPRVQKNRN